MPTDLQNTPPNPFDAPIPGQSLTDTPGNAPWEHPPQFVDLEEAAEYIWDRLHKELLLEQIITLLKAGIPVEALARMVLFTGFAEGKWSPDLGVLLTEIVFNQIMAIGMRAKIKQIKIFMNDRTNTKFHGDVARFKLTEESGRKNEQEMEPAIKEVKKDIQKLGIMAPEGNE